LSKIKRLSKIKMTVKKYNVDQKYNSVKIQNWGQKYNSVKNQNWGQK